MSQVDSLPGRYVKQAPHLITINPPSITVSYLYTTVIHAGLTGVSGPGLRCPIVFAKTLREARADLDRHAEEITERLDTATAVLTVTLCAIGMVAALALVVAIVRDGPAEKR